MKFKELFDREMLVEQYVRKQLKIIYEIDLDLIKANEKEPVQQNQEMPQQPIQEPMQQVAQEPIQPQPVQNSSNIPPEPIQQATTPSPQELGIASVVTEEEETINKKITGEISLSNEEKDNIQSFEDIINVMSKKKINGNQIFDDFSAEMITLCCNQNFQQLQNDLDKKSKIFVEIYYGYNKDDSVGIRFSKRSNSETLTSSMLIDNEIIMTKFSIDKVNQRVAEFRNYEAKRNS